MMMVGMTSFYEHGHLLNKKKLTLAEYASYFPVVELNTTFYGIKSPEVSQKWVAETPTSFRFILKAHKAMTGHADWSETFVNEREMYVHYHEMLKPLKSANKLEAVLFQFPHFFRCEPKNVRYLKKIRQWFPNETLALEFRSESWYEEKYRTDMFSFMRDYHFTLVSVDEPQVRNHSVPFVVEVTNPELLYYRLHGRNLAFWQERGPDWRKKRTLYHYSDSELKEFAATIKQHQQKSIVIFNNNSGGDAAINGLELKQLLGIKDQGLNPSQIALF
ncbi:DUF72 domain-containing protein [Vagococcus sp.]|uniref:DUF72 domain-containing protein n=1 Tax=Vagococcus sp. TaxID=1933889 RepID=UPI003F9728AB